MRRTRKLLVAAAAFGVVLGPAGAVAAHECYVASRSPQGNQGASRSPVWETIDVALILEVGHEFGIPGWDEPLTEEQIAQVLDLVAPLGISADDVITTFERHTLPAAGPAGKGIDHYPFGALIGAVFEVLGVS